MSLPVLAISRIREIASKVTVRKSMRVTSSVYSESLSVFTYVIYFGKKKKKRFWLLVKGPIATLYCDVPTDKVIFKGE